jgi:hypothetical protein
MEIMALFNRTHFQIGDIVRISINAFPDSDEVDDLLAAGELAEIVDILDDGIGEDYVSEALYQCRVLDANEMYVSPIDSELEAIDRGD